MKLKYLITRDDAEKRLIIKEYGELDKDQMVPYCEVSYKQKDMKPAVKMGVEAVISTLRTNQLFPTAYCASKLANAIIELYGTKKKQTIELLFNDKESIISDPEMDLDGDAVDLEDEIDDVGNSETEQLNTLLKDDIKLKSGEGSLKVEDIETPDSPEEGH